MTLVRLVAAARVGTQVRPELKKVVLTCLLQPDGRIAEGSWPGLHEEHGRWPFVLVVKDGQADAHYGSEYTPASYPTNIAGKVLRQTEFFSVGTPQGASIFEVTSMHVYDRAALVRMARVTARCTDKQRPAGSSLVVICGLNAQLVVEDGRWLGYSSDEGELTPLLYEPPARFLDYGTDWRDYREETNFTRADVGAQFWVHSWDENSRPDTWNYEVTACEML